MDHLKLAVVAPEEDVADDLLGLGAELGIRLDHHGDHVLELLLPLLHEVLADLVQLELAIQDIFLSDRSRAEGVLAARHQIVEDAPKRKYIHLRGSVGIFKLKLTLIENHLGRLPANTPFDSVGVIAIHLIVELLRQAHVGQLYFEQSVYQYVVRLDVPVDYVGLMEEFQRLKNLMDDVTHKSRRRQHLFAVQKFGNLEHRPRCLRLEDGS